MIHLSEDLHLITTSPLSNTLYKARHLLQMAEFKWNIWSITNNIKITIRSENQHRIIHDYLD